MPYDWENSIQNDNILTQFCVLEASKIFVGGARFSIHIPLQINSMKRGKSNENNIILQEGTI